MIVLYLFLGLMTAIIGAVPLGASNIAVINTSIKQSSKQALKIAVAAGIAEVILSLYALHYNVAITHFFESNLIIQVSIAIILLFLGAYLFFRKPKQKSKIKPLKDKYVTGFVLGLLNPPVLIYWVLVYGFVNSLGERIMLSVKSTFTVLFFFFAGVFIGKFLTLTLYSKFSTLIKSKFQNINFVVDKITAVLITLLGTMQTIKLYVFN